mmetsp:Transcript_96557/g.166444  ORF Transcript_96557/g.166444 Transcript_96557/m.166444 type:complete len:256 (-) Transcript_96557:543-1310(-)
MLLLTSLLLLFCLAVCHGYSFQCPEYRLLENRLQKQYKVDKYHNYTSFCDKKGDNWKHLTMDEHQRMTEKILQVLQPKAGQVLFDWGCGCGFKLRYAAVRYGVHGLGIDTAPQSIVYANNHNPNKDQLTYCAADGTVLSWLEDNTFDHTFSNGALYHLYLAKDHKRTAGTFCNTWMSMFRTTKPGGFLLSTSNFLPMTQQIYLDCWRRLIQKYGPQQRPKFYREWDFWERKVGAYYFARGKRPNATFTVLQRVQK